MRRTVRSALIAAILALPVPGFANDVWIAGMPFTADNIVAQAEMARAADALIAGWPSNLTAEKTSECWKIKAMSFTATAERGNVYVRDTTGS